jgi:hypothetical protein
MSLFPLQTYMLVGRESAFKMILPQYIDQDISNTICFYIYVRYIPIVTKKIDLN